MALTFIVALVVPPVPKKFNNDRVASAGSLNEVNLELSEAETSEPPVRLQLRDYPAFIYSIYRNYTIFVWSLWWALASCGMYQVSRLNTPLEAQA